MGAPFPFSPISSSFSSKWHWNVQSQFKDMRDHYVQTTTKTIFPKWKTCSDLSQSHNNMAYVVRCYSAKATEPCSLKCGLRRSNISGTWEFFKICRISGSTPQLLNHSLRVNRTPRRLVCLGTLEKHPNRGILVRRGTHHPGVPSLLDAHGH